MSLGIKPIVDFAFKKVFGSPENADVLTGLLNAILQLPQPITSVEILNPFNYQEFADDKLVVLDIRARDSDGRWLNIEMQVSVHGELLKRLAYYACSMFVEQLGEGDDYSELSPAISICLLPNRLFRDAAAEQVPHHRFRLVDPDHSREIPETIEVHTVELSKYNLSEDTISQSSEIEQWAFFLLTAENYDPDRLRQLLPAVEFQQAISVIEIIAAKTEDRFMYDQRTRAQRDYQWMVKSAEKEARKAGMEEGRKAGLQEGLQEGRQEGLQEGRQEGLQEGRQEGFLAGKIQTLQEMLGEEPECAENLLGLSIDDLNARLTELQERLRSRGA